MSIRSRRIRAAAVALATFSSSAAFAQLAPPPTRYDVSPFAARDSARQAQSIDPSGRIELDAALARLGTLGLDSTTGLQVINADTDDLGTLHVRMRQTYMGLRVRGGTLIRHHLPDGTYEDDTDILKRNISVSTTPMYSADSAIAIVGAQRGQVAPLSWNPITELQILPIEQQIFVETGAPPVARPYDHTDLNAMPDLNTDRVPRRVQEYRLAWSVKTVEGVEGGGAPRRSLESLVDAQTGALLSQRPLESDGTGNGANAGYINDLATYMDWDGVFHMFDQHRSYSTWDDDYSRNSGPSIDSDDHWGDGTLFPFGGQSTGSAASRQSAMVDVHQYARVQWDMLGNVFNRPGPDGNFYSVNQWVHSDNSWNNAQYNGGSGNISYGDGAEMQTIDVVSHEHGHAVQDFTTGLGTDFDEGVADVFGVMGRVYLENGGFAAQAANLPVTLIKNTSADRSQNPFVLRGPMRDMVKPSRRGYPDYYYPTIQNLEVHMRAAPLDRAFYFVSQGSSPWMDDPDHSVILPWGMTGIGFRKAARLAYSTVLHYLDDGADYTGGRNAFVSAAKHRYGAFSTEANAMRNAFAGANVSAAASNYPAAPPLVSTSTTNTTAATATALNIPNNPNKPAGSPNKVNILVADKNPHFFKFQLPLGKRYAVRIQSVLGTNSFVVTDGVAQPPRQSSPGTSGIFGATAYVGPPVATILIQTSNVNTGPGPAVFFLAIDLQE